MLGDGIKRAKKMSVIRLKCESRGGRAGQQLAFTLARVKEGKGRERVQGSGGREGNAL